MKNVLLINQKILRSFLMILKQVKYHYRKKKLQDYEAYLKKTRKGNKSAEQGKIFVNINIRFNVRKCYQIYKILWFNGY